MVKYFLFVKRDLYNYNQLCPQNMFFDITTQVCLLTKLQYPGDTENKIHAGYIIKFEQFRPTTLLMSLNF